MSLLEVKNLHLGFKTWHGEVKSAVRNIHFSIAPGEGCALVGESGSGKSVIALTLARLLPEPPAVIQQGEILFHGQDILKATPEALRQLRGKRIAYIFQEPAAALNPVYNVESQIGEVLALHRTPKEPEFSQPTVRRQEILKLLDEVGITDPTARLKAYPHELSGGMQQRVMIAMALAASPELLVADEPTTALDVTIQKQIMELLGRLKRSRNMAILLITHNLGIIRHVADRVVVLYRGEIVEQGPVSQVLTSTQHGYTQNLLRCVPRLGLKQRRLAVI